MKALIIILKAATLLILEFIAGAVIVVAGVFIIEAAILLITGNI